MLKIYITSFVEAIIAGIKDSIYYEFPIGEHSFITNYPEEASPKYKASTEENNTCISLEAISDEEDNTDGGEERFSYTDYIEENFDKSDVDKKED